MTDRTTATLGANIAKGVGCAGLIVLGIVVLFIGGFYVQMLGGPQAIWLNSLPAPDQHKAEVVQARADARELARSGLAALDESQILVQGAEVYSAKCERGQNNWKVHEGYLHTCDVTSGRFYGWHGDFPSVARSLHAELVAAGWDMEYGDGLPGLADQFETGHDEYSTPSPGTTPGPITFEDWTWDTSYTHGEQRVHFEFANRLTRDFHNLDYAEGRDPYDTSWSDTKETVSSALAAGELLKTCDVVILATIDEPYFTARK